MPFYRSNYSFDDLEVDAVVIDRSPELSDLFRSKRTRIVRIIDEAPVRRAPLEDSRQVRFSTDSYSPPPTRRTPRSRPMPEEADADGFTPLPPKIRRSSSDDSDDDDSFIIETRVPKGKGKSYKSSKSQSSHKRKDSKIDHSPEFIEVPSSPRRYRNESEAERTRCKQAEREATHERELRAEAINVASQERQRREEVENLGRAFEQAYIGEQDVRRDAVREAEAAKARAEELANQLDRERREKRYLERKAEILEREKRLAEETERIRPVLRPVDVFQDPRPINRDPGLDAIRRAQEDALRRQRNMRDDDSLYGQQREQRRDRRGDRIIFDDDDGRRGHRRQ